MQYRIFSVFRPPADKSRLKFCLSFASPSRDKKKSHKKTTLSFSPLSLLLFFPFLLVIALASISVSESREEKPWFLFLGFRFFGERESNEGPQRLDGRTGGRSRPALSGGLGVWFNEARKGFTTYS
jgi:hypothetical protein